MIKIENLVKSFKGNLVINNLSLTINDGEIVALVGKNGAGKSTLMRIISGVMKPDFGKISVNSQKIGVLLGGDVSLYQNLSGYEILEFFGSLHSMASEEVKQEIDSLDTILNFKWFLNKKAKTFSRGMRQKIAIAVSIIHNPDILLLDEPSTGLDLEAANDVINLIKYFKTCNKTILIATHNVFEIADLSDSIAFINNGRVENKISTDEFFSGCKPVDRNRLLIENMNMENFK